MSSWVLLVALAAPGADATVGADPASPPPRSAIRWGLAIGGAGRANLGSGRRPDGGAVDEYVGGQLDLAVEAFAVRLGRWVEVAPYFMLRLAGGVNDELFRDAIDERNQTSPPDAPDLEVSGSDDFELGLGVRAFPVRWGGLEPYVGVFGAYGRSVVDLGPTGDAGGSPFPNIPVESHAREGFLLSGALGARYGWSIRGLTEPDLFVAAELRYTRGFWLGLEGPFADQVGPRSLDLDRLGGVAWIGYQL